MTNEVEHLFMCSFAIHISLLKSLFTSFAYLKKLDCLLNCKNFYIHILY